MYHSNNIQGFRGEFGSLKVFSHINNYIVIVMNVPVPVPDCS